MSQQKILVAILLVVAVAVLLRTVIKASGWLWGSAVEGFASASAVNTSTVCPTGTTMYMYGGAAYCCDGRINKESANLAGSCRPASSAPGARPVFCALGAGTQGVPNCLEVHGEQLAAEGQATCPPSMPNYVKGATGSPTEKGRCCAGPTNADQTDCFSTAPGSFCDAARAANEFAGPVTSCEFQRAKELEGAACPDGWGAFTQPGQGSLAGLNVFGCSDNNQMCYSAATAARLQELGYDTTGMSVCKTSAS